MNITTTVSWDTLISAHDAELAEYREAYQELAELAEDKFGDGALDRRDPTEDDLVAIQQQAARYDQAAQEVQKRQHVLERLRDELGDGEFEIKMLSGQETMDIETELRMEAQAKDVSIDVIQTKRNQLTVDKATVDAPAGVPREDGGPKPSEAPNALTLALWEHVERFNSAGATDFRPAGCGTDADSPPASSPTPTTSEQSPTPSAPTDDE